MTGINTTDTIDNQPGAEKAQSSNVDEMKEAVRKSQEESPVAAVNGVRENGVEEVVPNGDAAESKGDGDKDDATGEAGKSEDGEKTVEGEKGSDGDQKDGCDLVLIQDTGFLIKIVAPGIEPFDLPVSMLELVQEIYQVLIDREDTCHRTCFSLQLDGTTLDNFAELKTIEGLEEGSVIHVVEDLYNVREARIHVRHVRDLLKSVDQSDAYNGLDCNSLSFINTVTEGDILDRKYKKPDQIDCTPPDYILPGSKERPTMPLHPASKDLKAPECLNVLTYSGWNPPPGNRKMHGDVLYLYIVTLEEKRYHVTASTRGFYVNQTTHDEFNPKAAQQHHLSHSLIDLLNQISPAFKKNFSILLKKRAQKHPFERVATPYQVYSWLAPQMQHSVDSIRAEDAFSSRLGYEEHIPGQTRDWNEELQTTRELPRKTLPERLIRERAIFKVHSDFVVAATRGAMAVIDGNIMAINPGEDAKMQMYLWNNIFFSLGFDVKEHYEDFGGDAAAFVAPSNDLQGVRAYSSVDTEGLYTLGTVVIDYRGYRVTAQSIIPGILEREQEQSVVYGSIDFGKTVVNHEKYMKLLEKTASTLKICQHKVINEKEEQVDLLSSVECKGIVGNDGRHYVLDLLRTFPPDVNYLPMEDEELSEEVQAMGYPKKHCHRLASLRHELIDAFVETQYVAFVKNAALQFQQLRMKKAQEAEKKQEEEEKKDGEKVVSDDPPDEKLETEEMKKMVEALTETSAESFEESTKEVVKRAALSVGSLSETEFNVTFNPDVFQPHVRHAEPESEASTKQKQLVKDAASFLLTHQIPNFLRDCLEHNSSPIDGYTLSEALHHNGINIRYLGKVTQLIGKYQQLSYLNSICISELICRSAKHLFRVYMQGIEMMSLSGAISHFLNCFLGSCPTPHTPITSDELHSQRAKKRNRKKNKAVLGNGTESTEWALETPKTLWKKIIDEVNSYYSYKIDEDSLDAAVEKYELQRVSLFRSFCKKLGLQIALHDYNLESRTKQAFHEEDIINMFPVVKHIHPKATDAYHVFTSGQQKIQQGLLRDGYELIQEALNLLNNVYGAMHPEIAACARLLARLNYIMGEYAEALAFQQRAVLMSERVLGIDHPNTITEYAHLALYCFANNQISSALRLMYRARYLALLCHGESHPEVALFDSNIGLILQAVGEFDLSLRFLQKALDLNTKFFGQKSLKVAMSFHLVARAYACKGDFRTGLNNEKEAYAIYKTMLGDDHERTRESSECLKQLTSQAVKFQKTMNEIYKGETTVSIPPLQLQHPTLSNVLDTLNLINGIVFVHISQEEIDKFREEMIRRHEQTQGQKAEEGAPAIEGDTTTPATDSTETPSSDTTVTTPETTVNSQETDAESSR